METNFKFLKKLKKKHIKKSKIHTLQINLWKKCNLSCLHCHVEAWPTRKEELEKTALEKIIEIIKKFPQIKTIDLTWWAPEMNNWFKEIVEISKKLWKKVIVRSNLTIFFEKGFEDLPEYFAKNKLEVVASLPCYIEDNVDKMRWDWVFKKSIKAIKKLNSLWYAGNKDLVLNLVYNTSIPADKSSFYLAPDQKSLEKDYKLFLKENYDVWFDNLFAFTNIACWRFKKYLKAKNMFSQYIDFQADNFNEENLENLMCKTELSIDYMGNIYDCDFNQVEGVNAIWKKWKLTLDNILEENSLDIIKNVIVRDYCFWCTAWSWCSCSWALT